MYYSLTELLMLSEARHFVLETITLKNMRESW
jgi:hypothetical protein